MNYWLSRLFLIALGAAVVGLAVIAFWPVAEQVDLAVVDRGAITVTVDEDGKTRIREKYVVSTPLSGRLLRIGLDPGDPVEKGVTLLAAIEPRDPDLLDARAIAQAEARVKSAEAALRQAAPRLEQAKLEQSNAEAEVERVRKAARGGGATESELDAVKLRNQYAVEAVRSARYGEEIAQFELEQAESALVRSRPGADEGDAAAIGNGWTFTIRSPIDGRVLRVLQESSAVLASGTSLMELGDPSDLEVEIDVLSSDAVEVTPGARVILEHWGGKRPLEGRVRLVEPSGFTKISTLGVEEQRVNVIVDLVDPPSERTALGDGFRVEARIVVAEVKDALRVPTSALFRSGEDWAVFVVGGAQLDDQGRVSRGSAAMRLVKIGHDNGLLAEVTDGLEEGDTVIVHPSDRITEGVRVSRR